ncbi:putative mitochondrial fission protein [Polychaeton citri CBS 116435]|uniref:Mitochondrial division protein 1 n=1 Tax=Polychaeton citri CBS 116435 TaxID=1314669 RepID=A0A9P4Q6M1_9PEZI|nr:putative mitochondrial fission protein [Polychaeton citri CBS 116435]
MASTPPSSNPQDSGLAYRDNNENSILDPRQLEALGRTAYTTASQLISAHEPITSEHYRNALNSMHRSLRRPALQRSVFSFAQANPAQLLRQNFNVTEIEHRALTYLPDSLLKQVPESNSGFSLLDGFKASLPEADDDSGSEGRRRRKHGRHNSRGRRLLEDEKGPPQLRDLKRSKGRLDHRLEMMGIRKTMCSAEIKEIDAKIANLSTMRSVVLDRLAGLEQEEHDLEQEIMEMAEKVEDMQEQADEEEARSSVTNEDAGSVKREDEDGEPPGFMSASIYEKLPKEPSSLPSSTKGKRRKPTGYRKTSMPVLHEHLDSGSRIREMQAHNDIITALDFDAPFGTLVTAAMDDTVRVWDLNAGRCMGMLEGHLSSVRCLQVEDNLVATGSMDASIRLWDLSQAEYNPNQGTSINAKPSASSEDDESDALFTPTTSSANGEEIGEYAASASTENCHLFTLESHVDSVTALHFRGNTLVSGSADKTLRQWDLERGRCVQTLDVLWAAAQASTINPAQNAGAKTPTGAESAGTGGGWWKPAAGRVMNAEADFVGALQVFDAALAAGTADGVVRLWDLRSGMVHRSLVGHTGPVTSLQFDDVYLVTGSRDRSIRIWDLRTGGIYDAFAYDAPISSMQFDARRIAAAAGEDVVKVYDKTDGRQWDCGAGVLADDQTTPKPSIVEKVRIKDGYLVEGRRDGVVGVWSC